MAVEGAEHDGVARLLEEAAVLLGGPKIPGRCRVGDGAGAEQHAALSFGSGRGQQVEENPGIVGAAQPRSARPISGVGVRAGGRGKAAANLFRVVGMDALQEIAVGQIRRAEEPLGRGAQVEDPTVRGDQTQDVRRVLD